MKSHYSVVLICCCICTAMSQFTSIPNEKARAHIKKVIGQCGPDTMTEDDAFSVISSNTHNEEEKCFLACMAKAMKVIKEDGTLDRDYIINILKYKYNDENANETANKVLEKCNVIQGKDDCDTTYSKYMCVRTVSG